MERSGIVRSDLKDFTAEVAEYAEFNFQLLLFCVLCDLCG